MKKFVSVLLCLVFLTIPWNASAKSKTSEMLDIAKQVIAQNITSDMTDYEKAKVLYRWVCDHMCYMNGVTSAYYGLTQGIGNCSGYSATLIYLLKQCNIQCQQVGVKIYGSAHAIDRIRLDGKWYFLDARFGDKMQDEYLHFCFNYEQALAMGYTINNSFKNMTAIQYYAPYVSGALDGAIESTQQKIQSGLNAGKKAIVLDLSELSYVPNRIALREAIKKEYTTQDGRAATITAELNDEYLIVKAVYTSIPVEKIVPSQEEYTFVVEEKDLPLKTTLVLKDTVTIEPSNATVQTVAFFGKHDKIAEADYYTGQITLTGFGTARIVVSSTDKSGTCGEIYITVQDANGAVQSMDSKGKLTEKQKILILTDDFETKLENAYKQLSKAKGTQKTAIQKYITTLLKYRKYAK